MENSVCCMQPLRCIESHQPSASHLSFTAICYAEACAVAGLHLAGFAYVGSKTNFYWELFTSRNNALKQ